MKQQHLVYRRGASLLICLSTLVVLMISEMIYSTPACYDIIQVNQFDGRNSISDLRCSPSTYAVSNRRGGSIEGTFNYVPKGKPILGNQFSISLKYMFSSCEATIQHTTSVYINDQFIMALPLNSGRCDCVNEKFSLSPQITNYLQLKQTNTFKIVSNISTSAEIYFSDVSLAYCYISQTKTIADLKIQNSTVSVSILTPESNKLVLTEPFTSGLTTKISNLSSVPFVVYNDATDPITDINLKVSLSQGISISNYLSVRLNISKTDSTGNTVDISPVITQSLDVGSIIISALGVNLSPFEKLFAILVLESIKEESFVNNVNLEVSVSAASSDVEEIMSVNNKASIPFKLYISKSRLTQNEWPTGPIYESYGSISDLAYFEFQPLVTSPFNPKCWLQLNMIINGPLPPVIGNIFFWSSKTKTQSTTYFMQSHFIGNTLFLAVPSDQLDCDPSTSTKLYMRVETNMPISFRMYASRKIYSTVSSSSRTIDHIHTPMLEKGEAFGVTISSLYDSSQNGFEKIPLNFQLSSLTTGDATARFSAFLTKKASTLVRMRNRDAIQVPLNSFPNIILDTDNIIYYFETNCLDCDLDLTIKLPESLKSPPKLTSGATISETQNRNDYGIYWKFVDVSLISSQSAMAVLNLTVNKVQYTSGKQLKLLATQNTIDGDYSKSLRETSGSSDYIQTIDCGNSNLGDYRSFLAIPTSSGGVWKFGFYIDPIVMLDSVNFQISQYSNVRSISAFSSLTTVNAVTVPEMLYSFKLDCSTCKQPGKTNVLLFNMFANSLQLDDRYYEIFLKIGQVPTTISYDIKSKYISSRNTDEVVSSFRPRYIFSPTGTVVTESDGISRIVSSKRVDDVGNYVYVLIKEVPGTLYSTTTSCLTKAQTPTFSYNYYESTQLSSTSTSSSLNDNSIISIDASKIVLNQTNIGKNLLVEFTVSSRLNIFLINPDTNEKIPMNETIWKYTYSKYTYQTIKYVGSIQITSSLINIVKSAPIMAILLPINGISSTSTGITSTKIYTFVEQDFDYVSYFNPLIVCIGIMGCLFLLGVVYVIFCYSLTGCFDLKFSLKHANIRGTFTKWKYAGIVLSPFAFILYGPTVVYEQLLKQTYTTKVTPKKVIVTGGAFLFLLACIFFVCLVTPMGIYMNDVVNQSSENYKLQQTSVASNVTHYACCRYNTGTRLSNFADYLVLDVGSVSCVLPTSSVSTTSINYSDLNGNGIPYHTSKNSYSYIAYSNAAINYAKVLCPKSEILIVSSNTENINDIGVAGICLGFALMFVGLCEMTAPLCKKIFNRTPKKPKTKPSINTTRTATAATAHSTATTNATHGHSTIIPTTIPIPTSNTQTEFQRREEELMRNPPLQPQNQPVHDIEMPNIPIPNFKQPSVPSQPIGVFRNESQDMVLENLTPQLPPPNYEITSPQMFAYDNNVAPGVADYNPVARTEDVVIFYQRSDNNYGNNPNNPNNV